MPVPATPDEVHDLATAVNRMAERLARYEEETRHSERLRTLSTLGAGIAHQIRNAATGCRIALDLHGRDCPLGRNATEGVPYSAEQRDEEPLAVAARQLELIEAHVRRFVTLGRPAASVKTTADMAGLVQQAICLVGPMAEHLGTEIRFQPPPSPLRLKADAESIVQMLVNLLVNAVQATAGAKIAVGGPAADADAAVIVRLSRTGSGLCQIAVGDAGPGPAAAMQDRLFEPFATDKPGGTGLGLVVSRQIAEDHGGLIRWERKEGRTWFLVELPLNISASSPSPQP
jgi:signal transduction histidine kinase